MKNLTEIAEADLRAENAQLNLRLAESDKRIGELENAVAEFKALAEHFQELFKLSQIKRFGSSSEKGTIGAEQLSLTGNPVPPAESSLLTAAINAARSSAAEDTEEVVVKKKKKRVGKREDDLSKLPLEIVEHEIPEGEHSDCPDGYKITEIGVETRDEIVVLPAKVIHRQHRVKVYKYEPIDDVYGETIIVKAPMPEPVIKGSAASPSLIAHVMTQKYLMHLPFYRQEQDFLRQGVFINRQNMANWSIQGSFDWLSPIYERAIKRLKEHDVAHSDDTTMQVLHEPGKPAKSKSYMSIYRTSGESKTPVAIYEYQDSHEAKHPKAFWGDWKGFLHTDGYSGYHDLPNVTVVGCWAHLRRKFDDAYKITKADGTPAAIGHAYCDRLFALEREFADMSPQERYEARLKRSKPLAEEFFAWVENVVVPPKLAISTAVTYANNQKQWLMNIFLDGRLELSNNRAERSVKPFVMGRKNWLFSNSVSGAKASAIAFSIIETAKENGLNPFEYLKFLFETLPNTTTNQLDDIMPWSDKLPAVCRAKNV